MNNGNNELWCSDGMLYVQFVIVELRLLILFRRYFFSDAIVNKFSLFISMKNNS